MLNGREMEKLLEQYPQYRDAVFCRGYFLTTDAQVRGEAYPFYGKWKALDIRNFRLWLHPYQDYTLVRKENADFLLIGHAYDPFHMVAQEEQLLETCAQGYQKGETAFFDCVNDWTGIFALFVFDDAGLLAVQDCAGIKGVYYGTVNGETVLTSHPQLAADLYDLARDPFVQKLVTNRFYNIGNRYLPGDISPYAPLKRIGANVYLKACDGAFSVHRFFPTEPHPEYTSSEDYNKAIQKAYEILHNGIDLVSQKWKDGYISLSGGTDSKTTLACANGLYDRFGYFSFQSKDTEIVDSEAAHRICEKLGLDHKIYKIPSDNAEVEDFDVLKEIIEHSSGYIRSLSDNEIRKHIYFYRHNEIGVEVKSWISEIVRVFFDRKYGIRMPQKLTPRHFSIFQTRYFLSPSLLKKSDKIYREYMQKFDLASPKFNYEHTDLYYWEVRMSNWGMMVTTSLDICHRITFPFNNRRLMVLLLSLPREKRVTDEVHSDIIRLANPAIYETHEHVQNKYFKSKRILLEKVYYKYRTIFYKDRG